MLNKKSKVRLHKSLRAQTTPHPHAKRWAMRIVILVVTLAVISTIVIIRSNETVHEETTQPKEVLGEQDQQKTVEYEWYEVKKGDTLFSISNDFDIDWQKLAEINSLEEPYTLKIGQLIQVPK